jgi:hypothetical protein
MASGHDVNLMARALEACSHGVHGGGYVANVAGVVEAPHLTALGVAAVMLTSVGMKAPAES